MADRSTPRERRLRREAVGASKRAYALTLRHAGATFAAIGKTLGLSLEGARRLVLIAEHRAARPSWHNALNNTRALHLLRLRGLDTLPEIQAALAVSKLSRRDLLGEPNFGRGALEAVTCWLAANGTALSGEDIPTNETGGSPDEESRPSDSNRNPFAAGHEKAQSACPVPPNTD
jgi:hypothetical protein